MIAQDLRFAVRTLRKARGIAAAAVAALGFSVPVRAATRIDPLVALRID